MTKARDLMSADPAIVDASTPITDIAQRLRDEEIGAVIVCGPEQRLQGQGDGQRGHDLAEQRCAPQSPEHYSGEQDSGDEGDGHRDHQSHRLGQAPVLDGASEHQGEERRHRRMGEVEDARGPVDDNHAERHEGVEAADHQARDEKAYPKRHVSRRPSRCRTSTSRLR